MTVIELLKKWLTDKGKDGLVSRDRECGCELSDLVPCDNDFSHCEPGYKVACTPDCDHDPGYEPGGWHIQIEKPEEDSR